MLPGWSVIAHDLASLTHLEQFVGDSKDNLSGGFYLILKQHSLKGKSFLLINDTLYEQKARIQEFREATKES